MVKCTSASTGCPGSCPHKHRHERTDACGKDERCSHKNTVVNCDKPYKGDK